VARACSSGPYLVAKPRRLFDHAELKTGQTILIHGAAGGVGSIAVQLARELGARVIGTGRASDRAGRLKPIIGAVQPLAEVPSVFAPDRRVSGKTIIQVTAGG
jgi:D-arabinose 1-dehydrogenase-like Zn-dependent alcohol dehydrogenase